jgi:hypothetical protein
MIIMRVDWNRRKRMRQVVVRRRSSPATRRGSHTFSAGMLLFVVLFRWGEKCTLIFLISDLTRELELGRKVYLLLKLLDSR